MDQQVQNQTPQTQQPTPSKKPMEKKPSQHMHDTKTTFLLTITLVLAFISVLSLFFVLRIRNENNKAALEQPANEIIEKNEPAPKTITKDYELNIEQEIFELDKLNLKKIEDSYQNEGLEQFDN